MAKPTENRMKEQIRSRLDGISAKILQAEKTAETQIRGVLKKTDKLRKDQLKTIRQLVKDAQKLNSSQLKQKAESLKKKVETQANGGLQSLLKKLNLPSQKEVDRLNAKVKSLEKKLKDLDRDLFGSA